MVIYLPPHGAAERLAELEAWLGDVPAAMCRELTKLYEEIRESTLADIANYVAVNGRARRADARDRRWRRG